jgi:hypothetical protein
VISRVAEGPPVFDPAEGLDVTALEVIGVVHRHGRAGYKLGTFYGGSGITRSSEVKDDLGDATGAADFQVKAELPAELVMGVVFDHNDLTVGLEQPIANQDQTEAKQQC